MTLDEFIQTIEEDLLEDALESLSTNPEKLVSTYLSAKEYQRAKMIRSNFIPEDNDEEKYCKCRICPYFVYFLCVYESMVGFLGNG